MWHLSLLFLDSCVVKVAMSRKNGMDFQHVISSVSMQTVMMSDSSHGFFWRKTDSVIGVLIVTVTRMKLLDFGELRSGRWKLKITKLGDKKKAQNLRRDIFGGKCYLKRKNVELAQILTFFWTTFRKWNFPLKNNSSKKLDTFCFMPMTIFSD